MEHLDTVSKRNESIIGEYKTGCNVLLPFAKDVTPGLTDLSVIISNFDRFSWIYRGAVGSAFVQFESPSGFILAR